MLDRRSFLVGAAAIGLSGRTFACTVDHDVVIIGAGVAGLAAARELQALRRRFLVLEARNRIGGRALAQDFMGVTVDRGAHWLHSADINPLVPVARAMALGLTPSTRDEGRLFASPGQIAPGSNDTIMRGDRALERAFRTAAGGLRGASLATLAQGDAEFAARLVAFAIGEEPERIAARDVARLASDGTDMTIAGGMGRFVQRLGADVPVSLGARVDSIDWSQPGGVTVSGSFGSIRARSCLITIPPGVMAARPGIRFVPELPPAKLAAIANLPMGVFSKVALRLDAPMPELPLYSIDMARFSRGVLHALHHAPGSALATLMIGGNAAHDLIAAGDDAAVAEAKKVLAAIAGAAATRRVQGGLFSQWLTDPFALGSYAHAVPGSDNPRAVLAAPLDDRLFFAGDTVGGDLAMTVGGAWRSGRAAARAMALA